MRISFFVLFIEHRKHEKKRKTQQRKFNCFNNKRVTIATTLRQTNPTGRLRKKKF